LNKPSSKTKAKIIQKKCEEIKKKIKMKNYYKVSEKGSKNITFICKKGHKYCFKNEYSN